LTDRGPNRKTVIATNTDAEACMIGDQIVDRQFGMTKVPRAASWHG